MSRSDNPVERDHAFALIGARIRTHRENLGLSRRQLAERSTLRLNAVVDAETGAALSVMTLLHLADALDCTLDALVPLEALG